LETPGLCGRGERGGRPKVVVREGKIHFICAVNLFRVVFIRATKSLQTEKFK
jgi:purine nucleoside phosphorylase